jgi:hypothetical protein
LTLSKTYRQDQSLEWGFLTEPEISHRARQKESSRAEAVAGSADTSENSDEARP